MVCVFHSAFVAVALWQLRHRFILGVIGAMALHWLSNFPISLMDWNVFGLGRAVWMTLIELWLMFNFIAAIILLYYLSGRRAFPPKLLYGTRNCPECHLDYPPPLLGLNFGPARYERCPHCLRWHWTKPRAV